MRTYKNYREAFLDLRNDIYNDTENSSVGFISKQVLKSILARMDGDIDYLENKEGENGRKDQN